MNIDYDFKVLGMIGTNCYLLKNEDAKQAVLIDPADDAYLIQNMIDMSGCKLQAVLLTHGHFDHCTAAQAVCEKNQVPLYASEAEKEMLGNPHINLSADYETGFSLTADHWLKDGEELNIGGMKIKVIHTPGHTSGGTCYYIEEAGLLFSGDTLFCASVGRTDLPTGSMSQIVRSVKEKLMVLPEETKVFPGHGESTSIAYEKKFNPYCQ